jgi:lipid-A-disaccharide synthase
MKLFFSVGEPSGDLHGANLIRELRLIRPDCQCVGFGGPRMRAAGCQILVDLTGLAVMWFFRVLLQLPRYWRIVCQADRYFRHQRPDAVILIDYPGLNWWIARRAKVHGIPVYYYGVPQIWAWARWRVGKLRRLVDHTLCKLPFEVDWYRARGCPATYVGHPYFDQMHRQQLDTPFVERQLALPGPLVTILPGSRTQEVTTNIGPFLTTAARIRAELPTVRFAVAAYNRRQAELVRPAVAASGLPVELHVGHTPELIHAASVCLACSGSVSLELLHHMKPTVIHYQISRIAYFVQRYVRKVRFITLVNLLASDLRHCTRGEVYDAKVDRVPFPEYLTCRDRTAEMAEHLLGWLRDPQAYRATVEQLRELRERFAMPGASRQAAAYIVERLPARPSVVRPHYVPPRAA